MQQMITHFILYKLSKNNALNKTKRVSFHYLLLLKLSQKYIKIAHIYIFMKNNLLKINLNNRFNISLIIKLLRT
jgi:hypothetical protein